jgi:hypothetical protein
MDYFCRPTLHPNNKLVTRFSSSNTPGASLSLRAWWISRDSPELSSNAVGRSNRVEIIHPVIRAICNNGDLSFPQYYRVNELCNDSYSMFLRGLGHETQNVPANSPYPFAVRADGINSVFFVVESRNGQPATLCDQLSPPGTWLAKVGDTKNEAKDSFIFYMCLYAHAAACESWYFRRGDTDVPWSDEKRLDCPYFIRFRSDENIFNQWMKDEKDCPSVKVAFQQMVNAWYSKHIAIGSSGSVTWKEVQALHKRTTLGSFFAATTLWLKELTSMSLVLDTVHKKVSTRPAMNNHRYPDVAVLIQNKAGEDRILGEFKHLTQGYSIGYINSQTHLDHYNFFSPFMPPFQFTILFNCSPTAALFVGINTLQFFQGRGNSQQAMRRIFSAKKELKRVSNQDVEGWGRDWSYFFESIGEMSPPRSNPMAMTLICDSNPYEQEERIFHEVWSRKRAAAAAQEDQITEPDSPLPTHRNKRPRYDGMTEDEVLQQIKDEDDDDVDLVKVLDDMLMEDEKSDIKPSIGSCGDAKCNYCKLVDAPPRTPAVTKINSCAGKHWKADYRAQCRRVAMALRGSGFACVSSKDGTRLYLPNSLRREVRSISLERASTCLFFNFYSYSFFEVMAIKTPPPPVTPARLAAGKSFLSGLLQMHTPLVSLAPLNPKRDLASMCRGAHYWNLAIHPWVVPRLVHSHAYAMANAMDPIPHPGDFHLLLAHIHGPLIPHIKSRSVLAQLQLEADEKTMVRAPTLIEVYLFCLRIGWTIPRSLSALYFYFCWRIFTQSDLAIAPLCHQFYDCMIEILVLESRQFSMQIELVLNDYARVSVIPKERPDELFTIEQWLTNHIDALHLIAEFTALNKELKEMEKAPMTTDEFQTMLVQHVSGTPISDTERYNLFRSYTGVLSLSSVLYIYFFLFLDNHRTCQIHRLYEQHA